MENVPPEMSDGVRWNPARASHIWRSANDNGIELLQVLDSHHNKLCASTADTMDTDLVRKASVMILAADEGDKLKLLLWQHELDREKHLDGEQIDESKNEKQSTIAWPETSGRFL